MLLDVVSLPGVADPLVADGAGGHVAAGVEHLGGEGSLLLLVLVLWPEAFLVSLSFRRIEYNMWTVDREDSRAAQRC